MELMQCPYCGKLFSAETLEVLDNGNPACPECVQHELSEED